MMKGTKITRPKYKQWYENELALCKKLSAELADAAESATVLRDALRKEHDADLRHRKLMVWFAVLDVVLASSMLYHLIWR